MSHFSSTATKITDKGILIKAIRLCPEVQEVREQHFIRGYNQQAIKGDIVACLSGDYDLGFNKILSDGTYTATADFGMGDCGEGDSTIKDILNRIVASYKRMEIEKEVAGSKALSSANVTVVQY